MTHWDLEGPIGRTIGPTSLVANSLALQPSFWPRTAPLVTSSGAWRKYGSARSHSPRQNGGTVSTGSAGNGFHSPTGLVILVKIFSKSPRPSSRLNHSGPYQLDARRPHRHRTRNQRRLQIRDTTIRRNTPRFPRCRILPEQNRDLILTSSITKRAHLRR